MNKKLFESIFIFFSFWTVLGAHIDGWAHHNFPELETFFTPWHAILYSGFFFSFLFLLIHSVIEHKKGKPWRESLPYGYGSSLIGGFIFLISGIGDMFWHITFGIEESVNALLNPTHLGLAVGIGLMALGAFRNNLAEKSNKIKITTILSLALTLSILSFMVQFGNPIVETYASSQDITQPVRYSQIMGVLGIYFTTMLFMSFILLMILRWKVPFGAVTLMLTLFIGLASIMEENYVFILGALLTGLFADLFIKYKNISPKNNFHLFSFLVPFVFFVLYFLILSLTKGIGWNVHMWTGAIVGPGVLSWILSYLFVFCWRCKS
ncbi:hypothetical protein HYV89_01165 [Candidatus Woesearchaeota archaeon]|nr:hypothetical protein [Candidatus Woesearchaeota archaeon]